MKVLLDNCVDVRFAKLIEGHEVVHARDLGWQDLTNGKLMTSAQEAGFSVLVTTDKNLRHQQNISKMKISLVTLSPRLTQFDFIAPLAKDFLNLLASELTPGSDHLINPDKDLNENNV